MHQSTAVIDPPAWESAREPQSTAVLPREADTVTPLDPAESDADWEARILAACAPRRVFALRD